MYQIRAIEYGSVLSYAVERLFGSHQSEIVKSDGLYILPINKKCLLRKEILGYVEEYLSTLTKADQTFYFIVGSCKPFNNIKKTSDSELTYVLMESDVSIDIGLMNDIFEWVFNHFFAKYKVTLKHLNSHIRFIKNNSLDASDIIGIMKSMYGDAVSLENCNHLHLIDINSLDRNQTLIPAGLIDEMKQIVSIQLQDMALNNG